MNDSPSTPSRPGFIRRNFKRRLIGLGILLVVIQLVPYGRSHTNPPVKTEPKWVSSEVKALAMTAYADCHSNVTTWRWYSNIAPMSWLIQFDVNAGRSQMNWSEGCAEPDMGEVIMGGGMPPIQYVLGHWNASLSSGEKKMLPDGLDASIRAASGNWHSCGD